MGFDCVARTHVGCRRKLNEDAILASTESGLWAVADGMGGHDAGDLASAMVIDALSGCANGVNAELAIAALERVNMQLVQMGRQGEEPRTIGSTVVGLILDGRGYTIFWAGDSRIYRTRDGTIEQLTHDHSLVQELVDAGMLSLEEAARHPNANVITRAVGAADILEVECIEGDLQAGDTFLLASDGVTRVVDEAELRVELIDGDLQAAADRIVATVLDRGAPDNLSLVIVRVRCVK